MPQITNSANNNSHSWSFSSSGSYEISDSSKLKFLNGSVKLIPDDFVSDGYHTWHDSHFGTVGYSKGWDILPSNDGYLYIAGETRDGVGGNSFGFITKVDQNLNEIWYQRYFEGTSAKGYSTGASMQGIEFSSDGDIIAMGEYVNSGDSLAYYRLMKIDSDDGSVIWQNSDVARGNNWVCPWGDGDLALDNSDNIYYAFLSGPNTSGASPLEVLKFNSSGTLLWQKSDDPRSGTYPYHEDLWQIVVDSEGSVYVGSGVTSGFGNNNGGLNFGIVKYDTDGNYKWRHITDIYDRWDQPRGLAIDSSDIIHQNGNASVGCGVMKYDSDGNILLQDTITPDGSNFVYCWVSDIDPMNFWLLNSSHDMDTYMAKYDSNMDLLGFFHTAIDGAASAPQPPRSITDCCGNAYTLTNYSDSNYSDEYSIAVIKGVDNYPNTTVSGTPLWLKNKNGQSYITLSGFSVNYGSCDENDVQFQISDNGSDWYWWNGSAWSQTTGYDSNTATEINDHISNFSDQFGSGNFYFKAFMLTDGSGQVDLSSVSLTYSSLATVVSTLPVTGNSTNYLLIIFPLSILLLSVYYFRHCRK